MENEDKIRKNDLILLMDAYKSQIEINTIIIEQQKHSISLISQIIEQQKIFNSDLKNLLEIISNLFQKDIFDKFSVSQQNINNIKSEILKEINTSITFLTEKLLKSQEQHNSIEKIILQNNKDFVENIGNVKGQLKLIFYAIGTFIPILVSLVAQALKLF